MRVDCGQLDSGAVIRPEPGEWHPRMPERLDEEELADWRAHRCRTWVKFAPDSLLEEAVSSELVSEAKFPASWENTGNFVRRGLRVRLASRN